MNNPHFGRRITELRKDRELSQGELADKVGLSQSSISRMEGSTAVPSDLRVLSRVARALDLPLTELLHGFENPAKLLPEDGHTFTAFCPNPMCSENTISHTPNGVSLRWSSYTSYDPRLFDETNYCHACGEELVKDCPSCGKRLTRTGVRYCVTCGTEITNRPTPDEWKAMKELVIPPTEPDDDLPF